MTKEWDDNVNARGSSHHYQTHCSNGPHMRTLAAFLTLLFYGAIQLLYVSNGRTEQWLAATLSETEKRQGRFHWAEAERSILECGRAEAQREEREWVTHRQLFRPVQPQETWLQSCLCPNLGYCRGTASDRQYTEKDQCIVFYCALCVAITETGPWPHST